VSDETAERYDALVEALDSAMIVVTVAAGDERDGCLVGFHTQCGIDPLRHALWISKANRTHDLVERTDHVGVHFLGVDNGDLAAGFGAVSGDDEDKFAGTAWSTSPEGVPLLDSCANRLVARRVALVDVGTDHDCLVVDPVRVDRVSPLIPLRLHAVLDLEPGHDADDYPRRP
jgi:flavin reductase (DIM6/NTAB) family NADH-FMN oxidoreductase RutF